MSDKPQDSNAVEPASETAPAPSVLVEDVSDRLMEQALGESPLEELFQSCCAGLSGIGLPLSRAHITFRVLHPLYEAVGMTWRRGAGVEAQSYEHHAGEEPAQPFAASPLWHLVREGLPLLRRRLTGEEALIDFPVLAELRDAGATDYLAYLVYFGGGPRDGVAGSWATDRPNGFSDRDIQSLLRVQRRLGVAAKMRIREQIAENVVHTYLGRNAGRRVLRGQIQRGDGETLRAAIWYSDLRGSTRMADALPRDDFIRTLNSYFECAGGAVVAQGGEVLSFIGDAILAIFPIDGDTATGEACSRALAAAREAQARLEAVNETRRAAGAEPLSFGLGLHLGDVLFGNIGLPERVSFSVIGATVNEVARLEALTKELSRPVLATAAFAQQTAIAWRELGTFELRGVGAPIEVLSPAEA